MIVFPSCFLSRLLVSASQDGKLIIWDSYTTNKVRPAGPLLCNSTVSASEGSVTHHHFGSIAFLVLNPNFEFSRTIELYVKNTAVSSACENVHHTWRTRKDFIPKNVLVCFDTAEKWLAESRQRWAHCTGRGRDLGRAILICCLQWSPERPDMF